MKTRIAIVGLIAAALQPSVLGGEPPAVRWSTFLANVDRSVHEAKMPVHWSPADSVAWTSTLKGYGQSSPVVWGDRIYVTTVEGKMKETQCVGALSLSNGVSVWNYSQSTLNRGENTDYFSRAAPTPVVNEAGVVSWFEAGDLIALDHQGKVRWKLDLVEKFGAIQSRHGLASSLALHGDKLFVWVQRETNPYMVCLQDATGEVLWKRDCPMGTAWSSPVLLPMPDSQMHLVVSISGLGGGGGGGGPRGGGASTENVPRASEPKPGQVLGLDLATGTTLWSLGGTFGNSTPTPTSVAPGKFLVGASAGREGGPSKEAIATNGLVQVSKSESGWKADYLWRAERATCGFSSPIAYNGVAYFVDRRGRLFALDIQDGKELYNENLGHPVWATPLGIGPHVYFVGEEGVTTVVAAGSEFRKVASNELWKNDSAPIEENSPRSMLGRTRQYAAVAVPQSLLIRRGDILYCIR